MLEQELKTVSDDVKSLNAQHTANIDLLPPSGNNCPGKNVGIIFSS